MKIYAIGDVHFHTIKTPDLQTLAEAWPNDGSTVVVVGDSDDPKRWKKWPFDRSEAVVIPGNTDPVNTQTNVVYRLYGGEVGVIGALGANWIETPWAHHHLHDQPCDVEPVIDWLQHVLRETDVRRIFLALHYPLCYTSGERDIAHPEFLRILETDRRIQDVAFGHVHLGAGEIPAKLAETRIHLVSADRLGYRPKRILDL